MARLGELKRDGLIAGDYPTEVQEITLTGPAEFKRGDVIAQNDDGEYELVVGDALAIGIICEDITVGDDEITKTTMYVKGEFNQRFLQFGGDDTVETHKRRMTEIGLIPRPTRV